MKDAQLRRDAADARDAKTMDRIDLHILEILQQDASATVADVAAQVGLSPTPCWKRIQKLEAAGVLQKRVAIVAAQKVGLGLSVHIAIQAGDHSSDSLDNFVRAVSAMPEVMEFCRLAGEVDYVLRVVAPDIAAYDAFYKRLTAIVPLRSVSSHFVLQKIKSTTALPLGLAHGEDEGGKNFSAPRAPADLPSRIVTLRSV
jgi:Lrp/AsnC family transcriptional regulator